MTSHLHRCIIGLAALTLVIAGCAGSSGVAETAVEAESSTTVTVVETTVPTTPSTVPRATCPKMNQVNYGRLSRRKHLRSHSAICCGALVFLGAFRSNTTAEQFERMISYEYGFLLRNPDFSGGMPTYGDSRDLLVELGTERRHIMAYVLTPDEGRWRIDVAALLGELDGMTA